MWPVVVQLAFLTQALTPESKVTPTVPVPKSAAAVFRVAVINPPQHCPKCCQACKINCPRRKIYFAISCLRGASMGPANAADPPKNKRTIAPPKSMGYNAVF